MLPNILYFKHFNKKNSNLVIVLSKFLYTFFFKLGNSILYFSNLSFSIFSLFIVNLNPLNSVNINLLSSSIILPDFA